jgi:hypothetical protein
MMKDVAFQWLATAMFHVEHIKNKNPACQAQRTPFHFCHFRRFWARCGRDFDAVVCAAAEKFVDRPRPSRRA